MRKLILATLATVALGSAAVAQNYYPARPDFPGAKQFDPASPAFLGVGNNRSAAMGMTAGGAQPSKQDIARHKAYVQSLRQQQSYVGPTSASNAAAQDARLARNPPRLRAIRQNYARER
jgi:hypothetical protein